MRTAAEKWGLVIVLIAAALLLVAELVDHDWLGAAIWTAAIGVVSWLLTRHRSTNSSRPSVESHPVESHPVESQSG